MLLQPEAESKSVVPLKFCVPHVALSFGPAGQLVRVTPALPSHGEPAQVELHSLEVQKHESAITEAALNEARTFVLNTKMCCVR